MAKPISLLRKELKDRGSLRVERANPSNAECVDLGPEPQ